MTSARKKPSPLDAALACQQNGDLAGAEAGFRAVLGAGAFSGPGGSPSELPLFIVGMPRSGTTLIEALSACGLGPAPDEL